MSGGVGPDRNTLGVVALKAARDKPYQNTRSHKHIPESPTTVSDIQAALRKTEHSMAPTPSSALKREMSLPRTVVDEDQTTHIPPALPEHIDIDIPSPGRTPRTGQSLLSQLPVVLACDAPALNPIPEGCLPSRAPTPLPPAPLGTLPEEKELHRRALPVNGRPIPLSPHENDVWTAIFAAAHSFASELLHYLGILGMPFASDSAQPTPIIPSSPPVLFPPPPNPFSTDKLISSADAIQAVVFAVHSRLIADSNAMDIAHDLARAKKASHEHVEARSSAAPSRALAAPCENLSDQAGHGTAPAYMDAAPLSALGLSLGTTGPNPYGPYGQPTVYDSFGHQLITDPLPEPHSRAVSQITWATLTAPPHETHPIEDSVHPSPIPAPISSLPAPRLPAGPPDVPEFTQVNRGKKKGKNKGSSSNVQTPKKSFAAIAASSLPVSGIQRELAKLNKPNSAPASLPSAPANSSKQTKNRSPSPPGNLDLIIKVGKTSITLVQFSYGTNGNCYISFSPATKIEEVELFCGALASCINIAGLFVILWAGKWTKMMISHVPVWRTDPITREEHREINTKKDLMTLLQLFVPNDLLDEFPVQDVCFLCPLNYVEKTAPGGHETIVLSIEDKSNQVFNTYKNHGLTFGYQSCYIHPFVDKATSIDAHPNALLARRITHLATLIAQPEVDMPHPWLTFYGWKALLVLAPPPPAAIAEEDHEMAASCFDVIIFADPWWGPIGSLKNDSDSNKCIFGSVANPKWTCVSPPIDTQLPSNHPSTLVYIRKGRNISADMDPNSPACRHYYFIDIMVNNFVFKLCPVYLHSNNLTALAWEFLQVPFLESPTLICGDFNIQHPDLSEVPGAIIRKSALGNEFLNWIQSNDLSVHNDLTEVTRVSPDETSSSIIDYTLSNPLLDSYDAPLVAQWRLKPSLTKVAEPHGGMTTVPMPATTLFKLNQNRDPSLSSKLSRPTSGSASEEPNAPFLTTSSKRPIKVSNLPTLKRPDSSLATSNGQKAALFHSTFFPHIPCSPPATLLDTFPQRPRFSLPPILESEIADSLALCHNHSAPGAFGTNYLLLKWAFEACPALFTWLYNACIQLRYHPICLQNALISPIPKPNWYDMASPKSYQPITLLETLSKLLEKIVAKRITAMADAGLAFIHNIQTAHAQKHFASAALLDISGYYNNIDHDILVRIMEKMGFLPDYSGWLVSYLSDRKACFRINGEIGEFFDLANRGVPQGSPLSPVFSSLFTAPLLYRLHSDGMNICAYIDDIMILMTAMLQEGCVSNLIDDIHDLTDALGDFGLSAEMSKTELIHFARTSHCMTKNLPVRLGDWAEDIVHPSKNSKSLCKTLQTVQNMACRWATGSFRTAPTAVVEHVISLPPIHFRIRKLCANYASKLRHVPTNSQVNARIPPAFDSSRPDVTHPVPLSPINAISTYMHPQVEFRTPYLMLPWEGAGKEAYLTSLLTRISTHETDPQSVVLFTDGSSIVKKGVRHNGWGWVSFKQGQELSHGGGALGPCSTIYDAEAWALLIGLHNTLPFISKSDPSSAPSPVDMAAQLLYDFLIAMNEQIESLSARLSLLPPHLPIARLSLLVMPLSSIFVLTGGNTGANSADLILTPWAPHVFSTLPVPNFIEDTGISRPLELFTPRSFKLLQVMAATPLTSLSARRLTCLHVLAALWFKIPNISSLIALGTLMPGIIFAGLAGPST
ncbi:Reverse transcriptase from mobile element jockey protein [Ceratobasidium theobromae]|uniref:Reverse transcriptase from mobile element jockey protein n=1 Tax=Ceratobasidium theobromae TaxID=1582974 RepID=A0A5N5QGE0_9AGAM|nr:Reverse transcriptase from mobile element jockey protein [Ceratobasidium theobromae]